MNTIEFSTKRDIKYTKPIFISEKIKSFDPNKIISTIKKVEILNGVKTVTNESTIVYSKTKSVNKNADTVKALNKLFEVIN